MNCQMQHLRVRGLIKCIGIWESQICAYEQYWCLRLLFLNAAVRVHLEKVTSVDEFCEILSRNRFMCGKL